MKIEEIKVNEAQHAQEVQGQQFTKLKLKKPTQKPKQELKTVTLPKVQLKSRIRYINDWPTEELKPVITFLGSVRQTGQLSRNIKEAAKLKKRPSKIIDISDLDKLELEKPEVFDFTSGKPLVPEKQEPSDIEKIIPVKSDFVEPDVQEKIEDIEEIPAKTQRKSEIKPEETLDEPEKAIKETPQKLESNQPDDIVKDFIDEPKTELKIPEEIEVPKAKEKKVTKKEKKALHKEDQTIEQKQPNDDQYEQPIIEEKLKKEDIINQIPKKEQEDKIEEISSEIVKQDEQPEEIPIIDDSTKKKLKKPKNKEKSRKPSVQEEVPEVKPEKDFVDEEPVQTKLSEDSEKIETITEMQPILATEEHTEVSETDIKPKKIKKAKQKLSTQEPIEEKPVKENLVEDEEKIIEKPLKTKLTPIKIERKEAEISKPQHAESVEGPQFTKLKLKKATSKPKQDTTIVTLPKFQLKSRIKYVNDWPPSIIKPVVTSLGSVRENGILSRNVKEAEKIKKKVYKQPKLPEIEKIELEKPMFGHEDIVDAKKEKDKPLDAEYIEPDENLIEDKPEQFTIKPKRPSIKKTEEIEDEFTIKKKLKTVRKPSVTLPEITEPENVTFRPKTTKTKEDVEQEFNIQLDSYAEEEISMTSKVKLKPHRQPTFNEEANETSIKFYEDNEYEESPDVIEILESDDEELNETANVMMPLKKTKDLKEESPEEISSSITVSKPKPQTKKESEVSQDISIKLERKPKYTVDEQEEVCFDVKPQIEQYTQEELSLSSKIKLKPKKKTTVSEAADETSIQLKQEIEDDSQAEEVILSEAETDENIEMVIKRKSKKPVYEVSEVEELSVEFKPKKINEDAYEEEQVTISAKRKPRKPSKLQGI